MPRMKIATRVSVAVAAVLGVLATAPAHAQNLGDAAAGPFTLTAKADRISTPEGGSFLFWGFAGDGGRPQYPGPTLIVNQGQAVSITVANPTGLGQGQRVSLAFPGQTGVTATCTGTCVQGPIALEANVGSSVTYTFTASRPGTFLYNSASRPDLQVEMGLMGALIVRSNTANQAYNTPESRYDQEYLFLLSEMDSTIHDMVEQQGVAALEASGKLANPFVNYWFINGRNAPDTMMEAGTALFPTQPYNALPRTHAGDRLLMRVIGAGRDMHPFHHHGNHARVIAVDGFLKQSAAPPTPDTLDLSHEVFTIQSLPGQTVDAIFTWTGKDLGWDIYGDPADPQYAHTCTANAAGLSAAGPGFEKTAAKLEYCPDHGKKIPVTQPEQFGLTFGGFWAGAFLGSMALLPPGEGGLNPNAGYTYMWHSHTEKEIINFDVFPGGMMTMLVVEPLSIPIP